MYSLYFLLATLLSSILALAAVRFGRWAAVASVATMALYFGVVERTVLATLPYVGEVAFSLTADKWPFATVSIVLGLITALYAQRYLEHLGAERWYYMKFIDFDYAFCKGCGVCAEVCPTGAIQMVREI